jgi:hypothetical protein
VQGTWNIWVRGQKYYRGLVGKFEGQRLLGRLGHRQEDNIRVYFEQIG